MAGRQILGTCSDPVAWYGWCAGSSGSVSCDEEDHKLSYGVLIRAHNRLRRVGTFRRKSKEMNAFQGQYSITVSYQCSITINNKHNVTPFSTHINGSIDFVHQAKRMTWKSLFRTSVHVKRHLLYLLHLLNLLVH